MRPGSALACGERDELLVGRDQAFTLGIDPLRITIELGLPCAQRLPGADPALELVGKSIERLRIRGGGRKFGIARLRGRGSSRLPRRRAAPRTIGCFVARTRPLVSRALGVGLRAFLVILGPGHARNRAAHVLGPARGVEF
jgi:hypothetical protein